MPGSAAGVMTRERPFVTAADRGLREPLAITVAVAVTVLLFALGSTKQPDVKRVADVLRWLAGNGIYG